MERIHEIFWPVFDAWGKYFCGWNDQFSQLETTVITASTLLIFFLISIYAKNLLVFCVFHSFCFFTYWSRLFNIMRSHFRLHFLQEFAIFWNFLGHFGQLPWALIWLCCFNVLLNHLCIAGYNVQKIPLLHMA